VFQFSRRFSFLNQLIVCENRHYKANFKNNFELYRFQVYAFSETQ